MCVITDASNCNQKLVGLLVYQMKIRSEEHQSGKEPKNVNSKRSHGPQRGTI